MITLKHINVALLLLVLGTYFWLWRVNVSQPNLDEFVAKEISAGVEQVDTLEAPITDDLLALNIQESVIDDVNDEPRAFALDENDDGEFLPLEDSNFLDEEELDQESLPTNRPPTMDEIRLVHLQKQLRKNKDYYDAEPSSVYASKIEEINQQIEKLETNDDE